MKHYNKYSIKSGVAPYKYSFYVQDKKDCIEFDTPNGVSDDGEIDVNIVVNNEACYTPSLPLFLTVEDSKGCRNTIQSSLINPCLTFTSPVINFNGSKNDTFRFSATPKGGSSKYTYKWTFPKNIFKLSGKDTEQNLVLTTNFDNPDEINYDAVYPIGVTVTDGNGCVRYSTYNYTFCRPTTTNLLANLKCNTCPGVFNYSVGAIIDFKPLVTKCKEASIDWTTLLIGSSQKNDEVGQVVPNVTYYGDGTALVCFDLQELGFEGFSPGTPIYLDWSVKDYRGILSNTSTVEVKSIDCQTGYLRCIETQSFEYMPESCSATSQSTEIPLESLISSSASIDWSTFQFIPSNNTTQSYISGDVTKLAFDFGKAELTNDRKIKITLTAAPPSSINSEIVKWKICDVNGCCSTSTSVIIATECLTPPEIEDQTICSTCGTPSEIPVFDQPYVTSATNLSTGSRIDIVTNPTNGTVSVSTLSTGSIKKGLIYTPNPGFSGTAGDYVEYKIIDDNGATSNLGKVTFNVICPGGEGALTTCPE